MKIKQNSIRQRVRSLMFMDQLYRDSDKHLWLKLAEQDGLILTKYQRAVFLTLPTEEIVARRRREFSKEFPASDKARDRRHRAESSFVHEFSDGRWFKKLMRRRGIV